MRKLLKIEGIPSPAAKVYSLIVKKNPLMRNWVEEISKDVFSGRILDVGTGPGYLPIAIAEISHNLEIIGIDISPEMVRIANRNAENKGLSERVKFQLANAENLPFEDGYFDLVISTLSFHHWLNPTQCIKEIYRVLKGNGEAWIYDIRRDTSKEVNAQIRRKYGWFVGVCVLNIVKLHSSVKLREVEEILSSSEIGFSKKSIEDKGIILKLRLIK